MKDIYIGPIIKQKLSESTMTIKEFSARINCDRTTVYDIFKRKSIDTDRLIKISEVLDFDFVNEIYYKRTPLPQKSQTVFVTIELDVETLKSLNLPDILTIFLKDTEKPP